MTAVAGFIKKFAGVPDSAIKIKMSLGIAETVCLNNIISQKNFEFFLSNMEFFLIKHGNVIISGV